MTADWAEATLGEVADIISGATPSTSVKEYWDGDLCWATPKDLSELDSAEISDTARKITDAGLRSCAASMLPPQSVLLSSRAPIGLVAINTVPMATNQGFKSLVPDRRRVDPKFLYWWLRKNRSLLESLGNGATFKEISKKITSSVPIFLPPLEEQRRVASILDAADALRTKRRQALEKVDTLTQSIFVEMFGDDSGWKVEKLGDCVETTSGGTPSRSRTEYFEGTIPWVKSGELSAGLVLQTQECITPEAVANSSAKVMPPGTVLLAMYGATVGEAAILGVEAATNQAVCCLSPNDRVSGPYLLGFLQAVKGELVARAAGGAQPNISQTIVRDLDLPLPPTRAQTEYSERVEAVGNLRSRCSASLSDLDSLFTSLQHRAFRGEL